jgi:hypothetical protein
MSAMSTRTRSSYAPVVQKVSGKYQVISDFGFAVICEKCMLYSQGGGARDIDHRYLLRHPGAALHHKTNVRSAPSLATLTPSSLPRCPSQDPFS